MGRCSAPATFFSTRCLIRRRRSIGLRDNDEEDRPTRAALAGHRAIGFERLLPFALTPIVAMDARGLSLPQDPSAREFRGRGAPFPLGPFFSMRRAPSPAQDYVS